MILSFFFLGNYRDRKQSKNDNLNKLKMFLLISAIFRIVLINFNFFFFSKFLGQAQYGVHHRIPMKRNTVDLKRCVIEPIRMNIFFYLIQILPFFIHHLYSLQIIRHFLVVYLPFGIIIDFR